ncbi:hypothetical protein [Legionella genomosp. 1]|uniref:hypothetical protein n=1 Tax=Legionella genomosp. 1 TaxID=1093625 RepID=UPI0010553483|nr:hypothetical protein [Legionella genomosp. 1]
MGKAAQAYGKYFRNIGRAVSKDKSKEEMSNFDKLVVAPVAIPVGVAAGAGVAAIGIAVGGVSTALGFLFSKDLFRFGLGCTIGLPIAGGAIATVSVLNVLGVPYYAVQAIRHRERTHHEASENHNAHTNANESYKTLTKELSISSPVTSTEPDPKPSATKQEESNHSEIKQITNLDDKRDDEPTNAPSM